MAFLSLLLLPLSAIGQDEIVPIHHYDRSNGLPAKKMYNMCLDRDGFVWFAAENGIFRFDGRTFYPYTTQEGLCDNDIIELYADRKGNIWCSGYNGKISVIEKGVVNTGHPVVKNWDSHGFIFDILSDAAGNLYMAGEKGEVFRVDTAYRVSKLAYPKRPISALAYFRKPYILASGQLLEWDSAGGRLRPITRVDKWPGWVSGHLSRNDGSYWISTEDRQLLNIFDGTRINLENLGNTVVNFVARVNSRHFILSFFNSHTLLYDIRQKKAWTIRLPKNTRVVDALQDRQGNIWLSAYRDGLFVIKPLFDGLEKKDVPAEFSKNIIGAVWFGNKTIALTGLDELLVEHKGRVTRPAMPLHRTHSLSDNISFAPLGNALLFSMNEGTFSYKNGKITAMNNLSAKELLVYEDSVLFLRSSHIITRQNVSTAGPPDTVCAERAFSCCIQNNRLWIGVKDGLTYYDIRTRKKGPVVFKVPNDGRVEDLTPVTEEVLALATSNRGVVFVRNGKFLGMVDLTRGLYDNDCKELIPYPGGLVVRHPLGLSRIDFATGRISAVSQWKGIPVSSVNDVYLYGDTVLLSTTQGLLRTRLDALFAKVPERRFVHFLQIVSDGQPILPENIHLTYDRNKLKVNFALAEYDQPYLVQYYWRINGGPWNETGGTSLELADLSSGDYVLELRARAPGFDFSPTSVLRFHVRTPFWRTWWFMGLVLAALVGVVWGMLRQRYIRKLRTEREKASLRHQLMTFEQKALNAMMNPHFVFNALGSIQHLLNTRQTQQANDYLVKFSRLIRKSLETSQQEFCYLDDEIERLTLYLQLEKMRLDERLVFRIEVDEALDPERVKIPTMILQAYVENAIIHGVAALRRGGAIELNFRKDNDTLYIGVQDSGPGFDTGNQSKKNIRFGLSATEKRLELLTQITGKIYRVQVYSPLNAEGGTRVELFFPLQ